MLVGRLPEDSEVKKAERGGRWPDWKQMLAESVTQQYRMHATYNLIHWGEEGWFDAEDYAFIDPVDQVERAKAAAATAAEQAGAQSSFESESGFS